ncbi:cytochrome P450 [Streptomyces sp. NPDC014636]|uniref:cytochrome P450 n=1 Tax=Streptomyces sp. NPDC014636 TaxID=3364876 RepID=UPI0036FC3D27
MGTDLPEARVPSVPRAWPVLGHAPALLRDPLRFFGTLAQHGDIVRVRLGPVPVYALTHPALVHRVLVTDADLYERGRLFDKLSQIVGHGLLTSSGPPHRAQRRIVQPLFQREQVALHLGTIRAAVTEVTSSWKPGQRVAIESAGNDIALLAVTNSLLPPGTGEHVAQVVKENLPVLMRALVLRIALPEWWTRLPAPGNRRAEGAVANLRGAITEALTRHRAAPAGGEDFLSSLVSARDASGKPMDDEEVIDQALSLLVAGVETTGSTLAWLFHELAVNPQAERQVHDEVDAAAAQAISDPRQLRRLSYTARFLQETLRLHTLSFFMRRTQRPCELAGVPLAVGAEVVLSPHALHRDPRWHPDPETFDPDRFKPGTPAVPKGAYLPFGTGAHRCVGEHFAFTEILTALTMICSRWRLRHLPGTRVREIPRIEVHPSKFHMLLEERRQPTPTTRPRL